MGFHDVCAVSDLKDAIPFIAKLGNVEIVVAKWRDEIFALRNVCPHQSQSFESGYVRNAITSSGVGAVEVDRDDPVLLCPWHTWPFQLRTGNCAVDPKLRVRRYDVHVEGDRVLVES